MASTDFFHDMGAMLSSQGLMRFIEGATEGQIADFERRFGVELPSEYKNWLLFSDGGECFLPAGVQLYGVAHMPLIDVYETDRPNENYVVIGVLASGDSIVFKRAEERVSIYNQAEGRIEDDESYEDFRAFILDIRNLLGLE